MRIAEIQVYPYEELSDEAKKKAYDKWLSQDDCDNEYISEAIDSMTAALKAFYCVPGTYSIDHIYHSCSYYRYEISDNTLGTGYENAVIKQQEPLKGLRLRMYILNNYYDLLYTKKVYYKHIPGRPVGNQFKIRTSNIFYEESSCIFEGFYMDDVFLDPMREWLAKPDKDTTFRKLIDKCLKRCFKSITEEYEFRHTQEYFAEECENNEDEFTADGNLFRY